MEQGKKNKLLLAAMVIGFAYSIIMSICFWVATEINLSDIQVGFLEGLLNLAKSGAVKWLLLLLLINIAIIAPPILNLVGWKKNSKKMAIVAIILYFLTLNCLSLFLCIIGIFWDSNDESGMEEKRKNRLLFIAGILGIFFLLCVVIALIQGTDSSGSLFYDILFLNVLLIIYFITILASLIIAIAISFFDKLRNNSKKVLIAAISYIFSFMIPSAILCFIAYAKMKKQETK